MGFRRVLVAGKRCDRLGHWMVHCDYLDGVRMPVRATRIESRPFWVDMLEKCRRIVREYPVGHVEERKIRAQIAEIERRLASL